MKKTLLIVFLAVISVGTALAQGKTKTKQKTDGHYVLADFRGVKWGSHIDSVIRDGVKLNFIKSNDVAEKNAYVLAEDELMLGTVLLDKVYYIFNKQGRFTGVLLIGKRNIDEKKQFGEMKYILTYKFGDAELREVPGAIQYYWMVDDVRITLDDQESQGIFTVEFFSDYERTESKRINMQVDDF
ncbi:MAG: hypothetical protein LPK45_05675 [Bacteroidota bacterium]|nr:hypothetical protein [Bacteroidota bacterium]MDX5430558.1 hypothetical protein [Bacteroidota bacterium]MDX5469310.1 hypothetical protein [Bacteroidota bacterium]